MTPSLRAACVQAVHVVRANGQVLRGARAWLYVLEHIGWGRFARFLALPPMVWVMELGYRIVASHRSFFARFMFRSET